MSTFLDNNSRPSFQNSDYQVADQTVRAAAAKAMEDRGLKGIDQLLGANTPTEILGWCRWWDSQRGVGIELLASRIFTGRPAPKPTTVDLDEQRAYGERIRRWLIERMPDVCRSDERVVEAERRLRGDDWANWLAASAEPHPAAFAAVLRLHHRHGKGALTVRDHGPQIRAAVRRADEQAVADCKAIAKQREQEAALTAGRTRQEEE